MKRQPPKRKVTFNDTPIFDPPKRAPQAKKALKSSLKKTPPATTPACEQPEQNPAGNAPLEIPKRRKITLTISSTMSWQCTPPTTPFSKEFSGGSSTDDAAVPQVADNTINEGTPANPPPAETSADIPDVEITSRPSTSGSCNFKAEHAPVETLETVEETPEDKPQMNLSADSSAKDSPEVKPDPYILAQKQSTSAEIREINKNEAGTSSSLNVSSESGTIDFIKYELESTSENHHDDSSARSMKVTIPRSKLDTILNEGTTLYVCNGESAGPSNVKAKEEILDTPTENGKTSLNQEIASEQFMTLKKIKLTEIQCRKPINDTIPYAIYKRKEKYTYCAKATQTI